MDGVGRWRGAGEVAGVSISISMCVVFFFQL